MSSEGKLHEKVEELKGRWVQKTNWGKIIIEFLPKRIGFGSKKGVPDELLIVNISFPLFGEIISLKAPVLFEAEKGGIEAALEDLRKYSQRTTATPREQESYIELPMLVLGVKKRRKEREVNVGAKIKLVEVEERVKEVNKIL